MCALTTGSGPRGTSRPSTRHKDLARRRANRGKNARGCPTGSSGNEMNPPGDRAGGGGGEVITPGL